MSGGVTVRGAASDEEVAAVMALLTRLGSDHAEVGAHDRWRATRRRALREPAEPVGRVDRPF